MSNARTTIKLRLDLEQWTGEKFLLNLDMESEIKLMGIADPQTSIGALNMLFDALRLSLVDKLNNKAPDASQIITKCVTSTD